MSSIGVAEGAKSLVIAAEECGAGVNPGGGFHHAAVELNTKSHHGFGFVDVRRGKQFGSESAKYFLRRREHGQIVLPTSGNIEQTVSVYKFRFANWLRLIL